MLFRSYENDPNVLGFRKKPKTETQGFLEEFKKPISEISYEGFKKSSLIPKLATGMTGSLQDKLALEKQIEQGVGNFIGGVQEFAKHPVQSLKEAGQEVLEHPGRFLGNVVKGTVEAPETLLPGIGLGAKTLSVPEQLAAATAKRASVGAAGVSGKNILQAAIDVASPELKQDLMQSFAKGDTHLLNEAALTRQLEADQLPIPVRLTEGQATQDPKDRKSTRLNSSHTDISRMPSSA